MDNMNYSTAVFLINHNVWAIRTIYEAMPASGSPMPKQTLFKSFDKSLKVGDLVLVPSNTRHNRSVVRITEVDCEVDHDSKDPMDWIIGPIDDSAYARILSQEQEALRTIKSAQAAKKREELAKALLANADPNKIKLLAITQVTGEAAK